eukprot:scaffold100790_cov30-Tisochrysis_lutea.AAC.4
MYTVQNSKPPCLSRRQEGRVAPYCVAVGIGCAPLEQFMCWHLIVTENGMRLVVSKKASETSDERGLANSTRCNNARVIVDGMLLAHGMQSM